MTFTADASEFITPGYERIALQVSYNGRNYHGWQRQKSALSVQEKLETALSKVADAPIQVVCAGRTDAGVHASSQIVHFDTPNARPLRAWTHGGNAQLPDDISIQWAKVVPEQFHARFAATARQYRYVIYNHPMRPALMDKEVTWNYRPLDVVSMQQAASYLVGQHDFTSFRASACQAKSPIRHVHHFEVHFKMMNMTDGTLSLASGRSKGCKVMLTYQITSCLLHANNVQRAIIPSHFLVHQSRSHRVIIDNVAILARCSSKAGMKLLRHYLGPLNRNIIRQLRITAMSPSS